MRANAEPHALWRHQAGHQRIRRPFHEFNQHGAWSGRIAGKQHTGIIGIDHLLDEDVRLATTTAVMLRTF